MGEHSKIEWTESSWNPIRGVKGSWHCTKVSEGCRNCYAESMNVRFGGPPYTATDDRMRLDRNILKEPSYWRTPRKIFVCSMTDLFHQGVSTEWISEVLQVINDQREHTFQVLTKRPERMRLVIKELLGGDILPNLWLGTSCEDGETYRQRIPHLAATPAAIRFVSLEPLIESIGDLMLDGIFTGAYQWAIIGGESGHSARPMQVEWVSDIIKQADDILPIFVKQLGSKAFRGERRLSLKHPKGGDPAEWPALLRVRDYPIREEIHG